MPENITQRPEESAAPRVIAHTITVDGTQLTFRPATVPELDRYFSKAQSTLVSGSVRLATDMCHDSGAAAEIFAGKPGLAVRIATAELEAKGFVNDTKVSD